MPTAIPRDIRDDVHRMREALRTVVRTSLLSELQIEQAAGLDEGALKVLFAGRAELQVAHVFRILRAIGTEPWSFFLELRAAEEREGKHDAA
jgi:hypothetical protein